jgi:hypothetical protein
MHPRTNALVCANCLLLHFTIHFKRLGSFFDGLYELIIFKQTWKTYKISKREQEHALATNVPSVCFILVIFFIIVHSNFICNFVNLLCGGDSYTSAHESTSMSKLPTVAFYHTL